MRVTWLFPRGAIFLTGFLRFGRFPNRQSYGFGRSGVITGMVLALLR